MCCFIILWRPCARRHIMHVYMFLCSHGLVHHHCLVLLLLMTAMLLGRACTARTNSLLSGGKLSTGSLFGTRSVSVRYKTAIPSSRLKRKREPGAGKYQFVDKLRVVTTGGKGGDGCISLEGESATRKKPAGGSGGAGGRVYAIADKTLESLHSPEHHFNGQPGGAGGGSGKTGRRGKDALIRVPCGTLISEVIQGKEDEFGFRSWAVPSASITPNDERRDGLGGSWAEEAIRSDEGDADDKEDEPDAEELEWDALADNVKGSGGGDAEDDGSEDDAREDSDEDDLGEVDEDGMRAVKQVADLEQDGDKILLAEGGNPGLGNMHVMSRRIGTKLPGQRGESRYYLFELKTIADVGLVGYPNAGKSTLLGCLTNAKPKVAVYPFTTLSPVVGQIEYSDTVRLRVADIPGLIDGAHQNRGLGHEFLRHIARTRALIFVVDAAGSEGRDPAEDLRSVREELKLYDSDLVNRPALVVANKTDLPGVEDYIDDLRRAAEPMPIIPISALESKGLLNVAVTIRELLEESERKQKAQELHMTVAAKESSDHATKNARSDHAAVAA